MKIMALTIFFGLCFHGTVCAQEKTLYDINQETLTLTESFLFCAENKGACSEDDVLALKADAVNGMHDLVRFAKTGSWGSLAITQQQARVLYARAIDLKKRLAHIEAFDGVCNIAIAFFQLSIWAFIGFLYAIGYFLIQLFGLFVVIIQVLAVFMIAPLLIMLGIVLSLPCLFWWL